MLQGLHVWTALRVALVATLLGAVAVADQTLQAPWPPRPQLIQYKVTAKMWDAKQQKAVPTSLEVLTRIHNAFRLWEAASENALVFSFGGFDAQGYDSYTQIPYDGAVHLVLNGRYNYHGETANGQYSGTIPGTYKKGAAFFSRRPGATRQDVIVHEVGHALGLGHSASAGSIMFSGPWAWGSARLDHIPEQDAVDLIRIWQPWNKDIFSIQGTIETSHSHKMAVVFAVHTRNGHTYSTRADHLGNFTLAIREPGKYILGAKAVEVSVDVAALQRQKDIPQQTSWFVEDGTSSPDPGKAFAMYLSRARPRIRDARLVMIDTPAPFALTAVWSSRRTHILKPLHPGEEVMLSFPEVPRFESVSSFGTHPDYEFLPVPPQHGKKYQTLLRIKADATEGERLVSIRDQQGRSHTGLVGLQITNKKGPPQATGQKGLMVQVNFDANLHDTGPYQMQGTAHGDGVQLRKGIRGNALYVLGTEDWVDLALHDAIQLESGFTAEFWFQREDWKNPYTGGSGFQTLVSIAADLVFDLTAEGCALTEPWSLVSTVSHYNSKAEESEVVRAYTKPYAAKAGKWHHAAAVYNPLAASLTLYMDGKEIETAWGVPAPRFHIRHIRFGTWYKANQAFRGYLDEFKLYNYPRSPAQIQQAARR